MEILTKSIEVKAYKDNKGNSCCAADFESGKVCIFYRTKNFGTNEMCGFLDNEELNRRDNGNGTLISLKNCPIWNNQ